MNIRLFNKNDSLEELTDLIHRAYKILADQGFCYWATHQSVGDTQSRIDRGECYVLELDDKIEATVVINHSQQTHPHPWYDRCDVTTFHQFAVNPQLHGQGLGSVLLDHIEKRAAQMGVNELACDTAQSAKTLIDFYLKRGYRIVGGADWDVTNYKSVVLSKKVCRSNQE